MKVRVVCPFPYFTKDFELSQVPRVGEYVIYTDDDEEIHQLTVRAVHHRINHDAVSIGVS